MSKSVKFAVVGPPHSGKSVFLQSLCTLLPRASRYLFRACPDGEGTWTWRSPEAARYRRKGGFTSEIVDWYIKCLSTCNLAPVVLVDMGGRMSPENARILRDGRVDYAIVLSGDPVAIPEWEDFCRSYGVEILASIVSDYHATEDVADTAPMVVHHLERGEDVSSRPVIQRVAEIILNLLKEEKVMTFIQDGILSIPALAQALGKEPVQRTLPNGHVVSQIVWQGSDLADISRLLHNVSGDLPEHVKIDGPAPAWLVTALAHECHPRAVSLNSPDGFVPVGCRRPEGVGSGKNLEFRVEEGPDGWLLVTCQQADPSIPLDPADLTNVTPPVVPMGAKIILSGRMPNWLAASLAMAYHGTAKAIALFQPGTGATIAWTHSKECALGDVV
ncbi:MAG TPA: CRISPR-associated protein Csx3 [Bacillota bacterium]|nr:CRISPR-associated protein Csx3 [Bacillota bacterium]